MAASRPWLDWATPAANDLAMLPGPMMPQRTGEEGLEFMDFPWGVLADLDCEASLSTAGFQRCWEAIPLEL